MSQVVIDDIIPRTQLIATSGQTVFNTNWTYDVATDVLVYARADGVEADDATQLVSSSDYNVSKVGGSETARITFLVGRTLDDIITIARATPSTRQNLYINTNFTPSMLNQDFGLLTLVDQQAQMYDEVVAPHYNVSEIIEAQDKILPKLGALQVWRMNDSLTAIEAVTVEGGGGGGAPSDAAYWVSQSNTALSAEVNLGALTSGLLKHTVAVGVSTPATAISGTDYWAPGNNLTTPNAPTNPTDVVNLAYVTANLGQVNSVVATPNEIDIDSGDPANPIASLSATLDFPGTFTVQNSTDINEIINDSSLSTASATNLATTLAIKTYIDSIATGLNVQPSVVAASTTALTVTYANGASGVGATLTNAGVQVAISLDGVSPTVGQRVLIKNQASTFQNGIYTVTTVGSGATNWVLTRATDFDTPGEISPGDLVIVTSGTTQSSSSWLQTQTVATIGTDAILFIQFSASVPVTLANGGTSASLTASTGGIVYSTSGALAILAGTATARQMLQSGATAPPTWSTATWPATTTANRILYSSANNTVGEITSVAGATLVTDASSVPSWLANPSATGRIYSSVSGNAPAWSTATYPVTTTVSQILYSSASNTVAGLATANSSILGTTNAGVPLMLGTMTDGQIIIGSTGLTPVVASLTAGAGISITPGAGSITIAGTGTLGSIVTQFFNTSGTYTPTSGMKYCIVEAVGGGGGSGGAASTSSTQVAAASAGGGGEYRYGVFTAAQIGASKTVTIGAGGSAGSAGANDGGNGGDTSLGVLLVAKGGSKGLGAAAYGGGGTTVAGGAGGTGGTGLFGFDGGTGGQGVNVYTATAYNVTSGSGGNSFWGNGANFITRTAVSGSSIGGLTGSGYGSGASGALNTLSCSAAAGGSGQGGALKVTEYI